jgi:hypothetical protein
MRSHPGKVESQFNRKDRQENTAQRSQRDEPFALRSLRLLTYKTR